MPKRTILSSSCRPTYSMSAISSSCVSALDRYRWTIPIQNMVLPPTSMSYLRTKVSLPSPPMRKTDKPAGSVRTASPSLTSTGRLCWATSTRPLGSMWNVRGWMARVEVPASVGGERHLVDQHPVLVVEDFERAGVLSLARGAFVAAGHQNRQSVVRRDAHLVREDTGVDRARLRHFVAGREVGVDPIHAQRARIVERDQDVLRGHGRAHVDRPSGQPDRLAVLGER